MVMYEGREATGGHGRRTNLYIIYTYKNQNINYVGIIMVFTHWYA